MRKYAIFFCKGVNILSRILTFIFCTAIGVGILKYTLQWVDLTGKSEWAETKIGMGSTYTVWKIMAVIIIIFGFLVLIGEVQFRPSKPASTNTGTSTEFQGN